MQSLDIQSLFFDLDGTLVDSIAEITLALNQMRTYFNLLPLSVHEVKQIIGRGFPVTVRKVLELDFNEETVNRYVKKALALTRTIYAQTTGEANTVYPGMLQVLEYCRKRKLQMAVVTNKEAAHAMNMLEKLDLLKYFKTVVGGDTTEYYKPHKAPLEYAIEKLQANRAHSLMIGDSENDYFCAKNASVPCVLVNYGYSDPCSLKALNPIALIDKPDQLLPYIQKSA